MSKLSPKAEARDMELAKTGPPQSRSLALWGKEEPRNEQAFAKGGSEGYGACENGAPAKPVSGFVGKGGAAE